MFTRRQFLATTASASGVFGVALGFRSFSQARAQSASTTDSPNTPMTNTRLFSLVGGHEGPWKANDCRTITSEPLPAIERLNIVNANVASPTGGAKWVLHGVTSNERYVERAEKEQLMAKQQGLGRPEADCAVLIPIRKNAEWWKLTQDEQRKIFEEQSHHTPIGLKYLPAIARCLHHCRYLSKAEPFDFRTWLEFAKKDTAEFDKLLHRLRASEEWKYVEREVEFRVVREQAR